MGWSRSATISTPRLSTVFSQARLDAGASPRHSALPRATRIGIAGRQNPTREVSDVERGCVRQHAEKSRYRFVDRHQTVGVDIESVAREMCATERNQPEQAAIRSVEILRQ